MSKPASNPFFETDFSKYMNMPKMMDMSKMMGEFKMPGFNMEAIMGACQKNMEAMKLANQAAIENMQNTARRQAELARQHFEATTTMMQTIMAAPTPEEKVSCQAEVTKAIMERCMANLKEMTEMMTRNQYQAMEAVNNRVCESIEEFKGMIKSNTNAA